MNYAIVGGCQFSTVGPMQSLAQWCHFDRNPLLVPLCVSITMIGSGTKGRGCSWHSFSRRFTSEVMVIVSVPVWFTRSLLKWYYLRSRRGETRNIGTRLLTELFWELNTLFRVYTTCGGTLQRHLPGVKWISKRLVMQTYPLHQHTANLVKPCTIYQLVISTLCWWNDEAYIFSFIWQKHNTTTRGYNAFKIIFPLLSFCIVRQAA